MKNQSNLLPSSANLRAASAKSILTGLIAAAASFALPASGTAQISAFPFILDGQFSGGGEWSDITPSAFLSTGPGTSATPSTFPGPANTLLYAGIGTTAGSTSPSLYLLYDFLPRTLFPQPGEAFASVTFPVTRRDALGGDLPKDFISVIFAGHQSTLKESSGVSSFFDIFVDLDITDPNNPLVPSSQVPGLFGAAGFGPSSLSGAPHLLVELEVSLRIQSGFAQPPAGGGTGLPGGGINPTTGLYDPDPVFWGAAGGADGTRSLTGNLQSATNAIIEINRDGSLAITPTPEPTSAVLLLGSLGVLAARRRRATGAA